MDLAQGKKHAKRGPLPVSRIRVYWLLRQKPWLTLKEIARILGISYNAAKKTHSRLKRDGDKVSCYCPICLKNSVIKEGNEVLCTTCGTVLLEEGEIFFHGKDVYPTNFIQRGRGLGSSVETENALIRALGLKQLSMGQVQRLGFSEPKFYTAVKKQVIELGGFREWDNEITNIIGRLTEIKCELILRTRCEITRKILRDTALEVLAEAYKTWPNRIQIPQNVLDEMRKKGLIGEKS